MHKAAIMAVSALFLTGACSIGGLEQGRELSAQDAPAYFAAHQRDLEELVRLVDACRPTRVDGYNRIWADGGSYGDVGCSRGDPEGRAAIARSLKSGGLVSVDYLAENDEGAPSETGRLKLVGISVHSAGLAVSGTSTDIVYYAEPQTKAVEVVKRESGTVLSEQRALTPAPHHWFWRQTS